MSRFLDGEGSIENIDSLKLAFIGDSVYSLLAREKIVCDSSNKPLKNVHAASSSEVCCRRQSKKFEAIEGLLTEEEMKIYKRARNATCKRKPKYSSKKQYRSATGIEALFGFLYLHGNIERLRFLFLKMYNSSTERKCLDEKQQK